MCLSSKYECRKEGDFVAMLLNGKEKKRDRKRVEVEYLSER